MQEKNTREKIFTKIYETNHWGSTESRSGPGSEMRQTKGLCLNLPRFFKKYDLKSILDIPCGDFNWMKHVDMSCLDSYVGADVVEELIQKNSIANRDKKLSFQKMDIVKGPLPKVDLVFTRDCFVHLSNNEVLSAIENIIRSNSKYFLSTTYPDHKSNTDTTMGKWRPINLTKHPFNLPQHIDSIDTDFRDEGRNHPGNTMELWIIEDIKKSMESMF